MRYIYLILAFMLCYTAEAQIKIAVTRQGGTSFYTQLDSALHYADDTSTIYLPGGVYPVYNLQISKSVKIVGAGCWPDSSKATNSTTLAGNVYLMTGADSGSLTGLEIKGNLVFGTAFNNGASNYGISRCSMYELWLGNTNRGDKTPTTSQNLFISECYIRDPIYGNFAKNIVFTKNIIGHAVLYLNGYCSFNNNDFIYEGSGFSEFLLNSVNSCNFNNNIILKDITCSYCSILASSEYNTFKNNLFRANFTFPVSTNTGSGNIVNVTPANIFTNYGTTPYNSDYHLKSGSGGKNAGTDGYDIGIYGTPTPWKEGMVPFNPHIQKSNIATETDGTGKLKVDIRIQAQKR